ncbi:hypothetical protein PVAND_005507 [Polypedilum vanderplanki]|uniref:Chromo domain-containing protein n=1 Tax=Polypedilum vanderplanki TaxID=319348 RepID=A0A9J6C0U3_POLVA|nr:hypothetical protein PVAND_005507 [Polypedilum vanderplanki]
MEASKCQEPPMEINDDPFKKGKLQIKDMKKISPKSNASDEYEVEAIVGHKKVGDKNFYKIHWKGYSQKEDSWVPGIELNYRDLLKEYKKKYFDDYLYIYNMEKIIDHRHFREKVYYRIRWEGFSSKGDTWQLKETINNDILLEEYYEKFKQYILKREEQKLKVREVVKNNPFKYEVEAIIDKRTSNLGKNEYLVCWKGYDEIVDTWEFEETIGRPDLINAFEEKLLKKAEERNATDQYNRPLKFVRYENEIQKIHNARVNELGKWEFWIELKNDDSGKFWEEEKYLDCPRLIKKFFERWTPTNVIQGLQNDQKETAITKKRSASNQIASKKRKRVRY